MDSEPDLAEEPDDDKLDMPNAADDPEKLAEPVAFRMLLHITKALNLHHISPLSIMISIRIPSKNKN